MTAIVAAPRSLAVSAPTTGRSGFSPAVDPVLILTLNRPAVHAGTTGDVGEVVRPSHLRAPSPTAVRTRRQAVRRVALVLGCAATVVLAATPVRRAMQLGFFECEPGTDVATVARLLGLPYAPVTPTFPWLGPLGLVPLPSKWIIEFGTPIATDTQAPGSADDPMPVFDLPDQVRETIQQTLYTLLMQRRSVFF